MDGLIEQSIAPENQYQGKVFRTMCLVTTAVCAVMALASVALLVYLPTIQLGIVVTLIALIAVGVVAYLMRNRLIVEYDLSLVGDELRVAKITGQNRRRSLLVAPAASWSRFSAMDEGYLQVTADKQTRIHMLAFGRQEVLYYLAAKVDGRSHVLVWNPSPAMIAGIKKAGVRSLHGQPTTRPQA